MEVGVYRLWMVSGDKEEGEMLAELERDTRMQGIEFIVRLSQATLVEP